MIARTYRAAIMLAPASLMAAYAIAAHLDRPLRDDLPLGGRFPASRRAVANFLWIAAVHDFPYNARDLGARRIAGNRSRILLALKLDPRFREIYPFAPAALILWNDTATARRLVDEGISRFPDYGWLTLLRGGYMAIVMYKKPAEAIPHLEAASALPGAPTVTLQLLALAHHQAGDDEKARVVLEALDRLGG